jgi:hypothetical protein
LPVHDDTCSFPVPVYVVNGQLGDSGRDGSYRGVDLSRST